MLSMLPILTARLIDDIERKKKSSTNSVSWFLSIFFLFISRKIFIFIANRDTSTIAYFVCKLVKKFKKNRGCLNLLNFICPSLLISFVNISQQVTDIASVIRQSCYYFNKFDDDKFIVTEMFYFSPF
mmetsp:Transcript_9769/g.44458  ORF Transcript_9769/g.44458 Transcript_9769/m.44458 type:complete len:127 (+) Transcript_9769:1018-1398(+)